MSEEENVPAADFGLRILDPHGDADSEVHEVEVDAMEVPVEDAEALMREAAPEPEPAAPPAPPPEPRQVRPARKTMGPKTAGRRPAQAARKPPAANDNMLPATDWGSVLTTPSEWIPRVMQFALYSGLTRNNPLIVTLRLLAMCLPIFISIGLSYYTFSLLMGKTEGIFEGKLESFSGGRATMSIGGAQMDIPVPEGAELIDTEEFLRTFPLVKEATEAEEQRIVFAAVFPKKPHHYLTVAVGFGQATSATSESEYKRNVKSFIQRKDFASSMQAGRNQTDTPFDKRDLSVCYGRSMGTLGYGDEKALSFRQFSCLLFSGRRAIILNVGTARVLGEGKADPDWCKATLRGWRDQISPPTQ